MLQQKLIVIKKRHKIQKKTLNRLCKVRHSLDVSIYCHKDKKELVITEAFWHLNFFYSAKRILRLSDFLRLSFLSLEQKPMLRLRLEHSWEISAAQNNFWDVCNICSLCRQIHQRLLLSNSYGLLTRTICVIWTQRLMYASNSSWVWLTTTRFMLKCQFVTKFIPKEAAHISSYSMFLCHKVAYLYSRRARSTF